MYLPKIFKSEDLNLAKEIIAQNAFGSLLYYSDRMLSTKAMMLTQDSEKHQFIIETHISKANPIAKKIKAKDEVLCDFLGAHTYISSSWYNHVNASTWNYEAVQIYGRVAWMSDDALYQHLVKLTDKFETPQVCPMTAQKIGDDFIRKEMRGALGMYIIPSEIKIKRKLSQNRDKANKENIIQQLEKSNSPMDLAIAKKMKEI